MTIVSVPLTVFPSLWRELFGAKPRVVETQEACGETHFMHLAFLMGLDMTRGWRGALYDLGVPFVEATGRKQMWLSHEEFWFEVEA